jgi:hypothetical protein
LADADAEAEESPHEGHSQVLWGKLHQISSAEGEKGWLRFKSSEPFRNEDD